MADQNRAITAVVARERTRLGRFIRRRVPNSADAEDILQDVLHEFLDAYRMPAPIEQASAWLFRVARNRIIDRFRRKKAVSLEQLLESGEEYRLDLAVPVGSGPEAEYARSTVLVTLQQALAELPEEQREVFVAHELEGRSFRDMAADSGVALNTLLARKRYAVLFLREQLQSAYDELDV